MHHWMPFRKFIHLRYLLYSLNVLLALFRDRSCPPPPFAPFPRSSLRHHAEWIFYVYKINFLVLLSPSKCWVRYIGMNNIISLNCLPMFGIFYGRRWKMGICDAITTLEHCPFLLKNLCTFRTMCSLNLRRTRSSVGVFVSLKTKLTTPKCVSNLWL